MYVYQAAGPVTSLGSLLLAGWLNELYGWRLTFFLVGVPGLILAGLVKWTLVEPRSHAGRAYIQAPPAPPLKAVLAVMWGQQSCRHLTIALIVLFTMGQGLAPWYAAFMIRSHGMGTAELGVLMGLALGLGGLAGILVGSYVMNRWFANSERGQMRMAAWAVASLTPFFVAFLLIPEKHLALAALTPQVFIINAFLTPVWVLLQRLVPDGMRATVYMTMLMLAYLIGMGIGPQVVGILSDLLKPTLGMESLRYAMLIVSLLGVWAAYHFFRVARTIDKDLSSVAHGILSTGSTENHPNAPYVPVSSESN
jgi:predicted MFS family arabinose efflux permease